MNEAVNRATLLLKPLGYRKRGSTWCKEIGRAKLIVNLQRSSFGPGIYVNVGVAFKDCLSVDEFQELARFYRTGLYGRLEHLGESGVRLVHWLTGEADALLDSAVADWKQLEQMLTTRKALLQACAKKQLENWMMDVDVQNWLGVN